MESLSCIKHASPFVALCIQCNEGLCIDCLFDHKSLKDHEYEKISKLKEKWFSDLNAICFNIKEVKDSSTPNHKKQEKSNIEILKESLIKLEKIQNDLKLKIDAYFSEYKEQLTSLIKHESVFEFNKETLNFNFEFPPKCFPTRKEELSYFVKKLETGTEPEIFQLLKYFNENKYKDFLTNDKLPSDSLDLHIKTPVHLFSNDGILPKFQEFLTQNVNFAYDVSTIKRLLTIEDKKMSSVLPWFFENSSFLIIYDIREKKIFQYQIKDFIVPFNYRCITTKTNHIYLLGGVKPDTEKATNELFLFDPKNNTMRSKFNMKEPRYGHTLCYTINDKDEFIYSIGGRSDDTRLNSVERYNINENSWKKMQKLNFPRVGASSCSNKHNIYVFGGLSEKDQINKNVEVYDINEDKWEVIEIMNIIGYDPLIDSACIFLNDNDIMIVGGARKENNDVFFTNRINFYNTEQNTIFTNPQFKEDFPFFFLGDNITLYDKNVYMMVKLRSESKKYGPFQKAIISLDFNRNQWKFDQMVEYDV